MTQPQRDLARDQRDRLDPLPTSAREDLSDTAGWPSRLGRRFGLYWPLKGVGTTTFMFLFFWSYFWILKHPHGEAVVMPEIWLDHWIDFTPSAFPVYLSLWLYVFLPPAILGNLRALVWFGVWVGAMCVFCLALFWWFPTQTPMFDMDWSRYPGVSFVKDMDAPGNACPSLHVGSAVFSFCWLQRILRQLRTPVVLQWISAVQCVAIIWSTMATLQHVALDVFAGIAVGLAFAAASLAHVKNTA